MTTTMTDVATIPRLDHDQGMVLAETEFDRILGLLRQLGGEEWQRPTVCQAWDVQALVAHVVGMGEAQASFRQFAHDYRAARRRSDGPMIDAMTAAQVRDRAGLTPNQLVERLAEVSPKAVRARRRTPAVLRWSVRMKQDSPFDAERWKYGYLVDTIFTRDTWMHRLDLCRATGREMVVTVEHDGRLIADVVADWASRHRQPFSLVLTGVPGGRWATDGDAPERIEMDALDFCWAVAGRARGAGLLATPVPF